MTHDHADLQTKRTKRVEADVRKLLDLMEPSLVNPFDQENPDLVGLSTATAVSVSITNDIMAAKNIGLKAFYEFNKCPTGACDKIFLDTLPKTKALNFFSSNQEDKVGEI